MAARKKSEIQALGALAGALVGLLVVASAQLPAAIILIFVLVGSVAGAEVWKRAQQSAGPPAPPAPPAE